MPVDNFTNIDNLKEDDQVKSQVETELNGLGFEIKSFYEIKENAVNFKEDIVKQYLNKLKDDSNIKGKSSKESWQYLVSDDKRFVTCVMAMQIALESLGYEIDKIDGKLGKNTRAGILWFQKQCNLGLKDGLPGQETIIKLCDALDKPGEFAAKQEFKPNGVSVAKSGGVSGKGKGGTGAGVKSEQSSVGGTAGVEQKGAVDEGYKGVITLEEEKQAIVEDIKAKFGNILKDPKGDTIGLTSAGKLTISSIAVPNTVLTLDIDLAKCLDKNANIDESRTKKVLEEGVKKLVNKKKAQTGWYLLRKDYRGEGSGGKYYIGADLLKLDEKSLGDLSPMEKGRIKRYFNKFDYYGIELDGNDTTYDGDNGKIKLVLDDDSTNEKYNQYKNNEDLIIDAAKVVKDDYTLNMKEFCKIMRGVIINIIRRPDFK